MSTRPPNYDARRLAEPVISVHRHGGGFRASIRLNGAVAVAGAQTPGSAVDYALASLKTTAQTNASRAAADLHAASRALEDHSYKPNDHWHAHMKRAKKLRTHQSRR